MLRGFPDDPPPTPGEELDRDMQDRLWAAIWLDDLKTDQRLRLAIVSHEGRSEAPDGVGLSDGHHDLPNLGVRFQVPVCLDDLAQGERLRNHRLEATGL